MSWATGRRLVILAVVGVVLLLIVAGSAFLIFNKPPTCTDGKQNQDEEGIDCGGSCTYVCTPSVVPPAVSFARDILQGSRTDVIAYIKNPNPSLATKNIHYTVELYDTNRAIVATKEGAVDLAPGTETVIFLPNVFSGNQLIDRVFLSLDEGTAQWFRAEAPPLIPMVRDALITGTETAPRVSATISNPFVSALRNIVLIATVFDAEGNAIAASQTVVSELPPQASTNVLFTWNMPFSAPVSRIDVRPTIPVPAP